MKVHRSLAAAILAAAALFAPLPVLAEGFDARPITIETRNGFFLDARHILISNDGGRRVRLADLRQDGRIVAPGLVGYALAHSAVAVLLPGAVPPGAFEVATDVVSRTLDIR